MDTDEKDEFTYWASGERRMTIMDRRLFTEGMRRSLPE